MASLRSTWTSIPADHKRAIGGDQGCPDEFKTIAQAADARSTPGDDVDPDTGEAVQPMQSDTPAAPEPLGDDADEYPNTAHTHGAVARGGPGHDRRTAERRGGEKGDRRGRT